MSKIKSGLRQLFSSPATTSMGVVSVAALLFAGVLVARSAPRPDLDIQLSDGAVWLSSTAIGGVSLLDGGSGTIATSLGVANSGDDFEVEQFGSDAVIVNRTDGTVSRLDGATWTIATGRVTFGQPSGELAVVADTRGGWVMTPGQASPVDLETLQGTAPLPVAAPFAGGAVNAAGELLYSSTDPSQPVLRFAAGTGDTSTINDLSGPTTLVDLGQTVAGVDLDDRSVWLDGVGIVCDELEFPPDATLHANGGAGQLIVVSDEGGAFVWDPTESGCPGTNQFISLFPGSYGEPALTDGWAVVPDLGAGAVLVIDLDEREVTSRQAIAGLTPGASIDLIAEDGAIWYNDPASAKAGLVRRDGTLLPIEKYEEGASGFTAAPIEDPDGDTSDIAVAGAFQEQEDPTTEETPEDGEEEEEETVAETPEPEEPAPTEEPQPTPEPQPTDPGTTDPDPGGGDPDETDPDETDPNDGDSDEGAGPEPEPEGVVITMAVSAAQVIAGETINFTAVTQHGQPNNWESAVSPGGPVLQPLEEFGSFRYLFPDPGLFIVTLTACDPAGNCDDARAQVEIVEDPDAISLVAGFSAPPRARVGDNVDFVDASQGDPENWAWSFEDGSPATSAEQNPSATFNSPGMKTVTLSVTKGSATDTFTQQIEIEAATTDPSPFGLDCSPISLEVGQTSSCSLQGDAADFDNLSFSVSATSGSPATSEPAPGQLNLSTDSLSDVTVTLTGEDKGTGETRSDSVVVQFIMVFCTQALPNPTISGPTNLEVGETGSFTGSGEVCTSPGYSWSAQGNASISDPSAETTAISWSQAGTYVITLDYDSGGSGSNTTNHTVVVTDPSSGTGPSVTMTGPTSLTTDEIGDFIVQSVDPGSGTTTGNFDWSFPGGNGIGQQQDINENYSVSYSTPGTYTVTVTYTNDAGSDSASVTVNVSDPVAQEPPPAVSISGPTSLDTNQVGTFTVSNTGGSISTYAWSVLSTGANGSGSSFDTFWASTGNYTVTLDVNGPGGSDQATLNVTVSDPPPVIPALGLSCSPSTRPADGTSAATCAISNNSEFTNISYSVSNPSGLQLNQWGSPDAPETYIAAFDPGSITVTASAVHTASGTTVNAGPVTITYEAVGPPPAPEISVSCDETTTTTAEIFTCQLSSGNAAEFESPSWSIQPNGTLSWGGAGSFSIDVQGTVAGTVTVSLSAVHTATGETKFASANVTIT